MKVFCILLVLVQLKNVMLDTNQNDNYNDNSDNAGNIKSLKSSVFYKAVNYLSNKTYENEVKVSFLSMPYNIYYTHIFMAFRSADSQLSTVSFRGDGPDSEVNGVNLVLAFRKLDYMYAPHPITFILDFVRGCYNSIAGEHRNNTFISIMRYGDDETITRGLISATSERFLRHKTLGSHHYLWEKRSTSNSFLESKRYVQLTNISDGESRQSACDWGRVGLAREFADDQTLYGLHNQR